MRFCDFPVFNYQRVPLAAISTEDGAAVKLQVQGAGEGAGRVGKEAEESKIVMSMANVGRFREEGKGKGTGDEQPVQKKLRSSKHTVSWILPLDRAARPMPS